MNNEALFTVCFFLLLSLSYIGLAQTTLYKKQCSSKQGVKLELKTPYIFPVFATMPPYGYQSQS